MTTLHAGGKFGGGGYKVSGGLHGVGVSVVNALSARCVLEVDRDGTTYRQEYAAEKARGGTVQAGVPQGPLKKVGASKRGHTGTTVTFWPDPDVFEEIEFRAVDRDRTPAGDGVPQPRARDRVPRRAARAQAARRCSRTTPASSTSCAT